MSDKQKEFQQEKLELRKVIEEQRDQLKNGASDTGDGSKSTNADVEALNKELIKAKQENQEAAIEKERFQSQLEMLVQELEQKQVYNLIINLKLIYFHVGFFWKPYYIPYIIEHIFSISFFFFFYTTLLLFSSSVMFFNILLSCQSRDH